MFCPHPVYCIYSATWKWCAWTGKTVVYFGALVLRGWTGGSGCLTGWRSDVMRWRVSGHPWPPALVAAWILFCYADQPSVLIGLLFVTHKKAISAELTATDSECGQMELFPSSRVWQDYVFVYCDSLNISKFLPGFLKFKYSSTEVY